MLTVEALTLAVPGRTLLSGLSASFAPGQCWAVLGRNGSGKTTLLHALAGLSASHQGRVLLSGEPLAALPARQRARRIALLLQEEPDAFWGSVRDYVMLGRYPHDGGIAPQQGAEVGEVAQLLAVLELASMAERPCRTLSGGERQRARIAQTLAQAPDIYLLDEPLLHLDICHQSEIMRLFRTIAQQPKLVIMVLHDPWLARHYCDHVLLLSGDGGAVAKPANLVTQADLQAVYGCQLPDFSCAYAS